MVLPILEELQDGQDDVVDVAEAGSLRFLGVVEASCPVHSDVCLLLVQLHSTGCGEKNHREVKARVKTLGQSLRVKPQPLPRVFGGSTKLQPKGLTPTNQGKGWKWDTHFSSLPTFASEQKNLHKPVPSTQLGSHWSQSGFLSALNEAFYLRYVQVTE